MRRRTQLARGGGLQRIAPQNDFPDEKGRQSAPLFL